MDQREQEPKTYKVVHVGGSEQEDGIVVRELGLVDVCAVGPDVRTIVDIVLCVHESDSGDPIPCLFGPVSISLVSCVPSQPSAEVEKAAVCNA